MLWTIYNDHYMVIYCCVCRLVEEVREACEVDITNDDVFMNARCVFVCVCVCVCVSLYFSPCVLYACVCVHVRVCSCALWYVHHCAC